MIYSEEIEILMKVHARNLESLIQITVIACALLASKQLGNDFMQLSLFEIGGSRGNDGSTSNKERMYFSFRHAHELILDIFSLGQLL